MRWNRFMGYMVGAAAAASMGVAYAADNAVDPNLAEYKPAGAVSGSIKSVGSDTLNNLMTLWSEGFIKNYPNVQVEIEGKGSGTAPPALTAGTCNFAPMSRAMKATEIDSFKSKFGYAPVALPTAIDALAVVVHKDNPIKGLTLAQVDAVFSKSRKRGGAKDIATWGDLGLTGEFANKPISLYGRNSASGTYGFFKEHTLGNGDFKDGVKEQPGTSSVIQGVGADKFGIGYGGIGYLTAEVKAVPLADKGDKFVVANRENAYTGDYPLARFLFVYINAKTGEPLDPLRSEFVRYIFSKQGQEVVVKDGYFPVTAAVAAETFKALGIK